MKNIVFVTSNDNKLREASEILGFELRREAIEVDEIQDMDLISIIEHKTKQAYALLKVPLFAEDVGLYFDAWNGFPGPFIKWLGKSVGYETIPLLLPQDNRQVEWVVMYGYYDGTTFSSFEGRVNGSIIKNAAGESNFGFDPIFIPEGQTQTYAEMGPEVKYKFSARAEALIKLKDYIETLELSN